MDTASENHSSFSSRLLPAFAQETIRLGICVVPTRDGEKQYALSKWKEYQKRLPTPHDLEKWFLPSQQGIGIVPGKVSGNIEALDFDLSETFSTFCEVMRGIGQSPLLDRVMSRAMGGAV